MHSNVAVSNKMGKRSMSPTERKSHLLGSLEKNNFPVNWQSCCLTSSNGKQCCINYFRHSNCHLFRKFASFKCIFSINTLDSRAVTTFTCHCCYRNHKSLLIRLIASSALLPKLSMQVLISFNKIV